MVAAALVGADHRILIASRPPGSHMAGGWEFPGGKLISGEAPLQGLARELAEEIGVQLGAGPHRPIGKVSHSYAERDVLIEAWLVTDFLGSPQALEGQELRWCLKSELAEVPLLPADAPLIDTLQLPAVIEQLSGCGCRIRGFHECVPGTGVRCASPDEARSAGAAGARFLVMDAELDDAVLRHLCAAVLPPVFAKGISLEAAWRAGASGIHRL